MMLSSSAEGPPPAGAGGALHCCGLHIPVATHLPSVSALLHHNERQQHNNNISTTIGGAPIVTVQPLQVDAQLRERRTGSSLGGASSISSGGIPKSGIAEKWKKAQLLAWEPSAWEKELLRRTWHDDFDFLFEVGTAIYEYIFAHNPYTRQLFPTIHRYGTRWRQSQEFRTMALKFVQNITYSTRNLDRMAGCLDPHLQRIGQLHVKLVARGFKPEYWDCFPDAMESVMEKHIANVAEFSEPQRLEALRVWRRLASYIVVQLKRGFKHRSAEKR